MIKNIFFLLSCIFISCCLNLTTAYAQPVLNPANGHYYEQINIASAPLTWSEARDAAAAQTYNGLQGHLATVTSSNENDFIVGQWPGIGTHPDHTWIGGTEVSNNWQWITGEPWSYTNWGSGQPSGDGQCLEYWDNNTWNDEPCSNRKNFYLVEFGQPPAPVPTMTEWSMIIFTVLAGLYSVYYLRRQKRAEK